MRGETVVTALGVDPAGGVDRCQEWRDDQASSPQVEAGYAGSGRENKWEGGQGKCSERNERRGERKRKLKETESAAPKPDSGRETQAGRTFGVGNS